MLMITVEADDDIVIVRLDGRLAGPEARELTVYWETAAFRQLPRPLMLDLTGVTCIDQVGMDLVARIRERGEALLHGVPTDPDEEESCMATRLTIHTRGSTLELEGTLRAPATAELRHRVDALLRRGDRCIVLDLEQLSDIDAAGIGELIRAFNLARAGGAAFRLVGTRGRVRHLLEVAGVLRLLNPAGGPLEESA